MVLEKTRFGGFFFCLRFKQAACREFASDEARKITIAGKPAPARLLHPRTHL